MIKFIPLPYHFKTGKIEYVGFCNMDGRSRHIFIRLARNPLVWFVVCHRFFGRVQNCRKNVPARQGTRGLDRQAFCLCIGCHRCWSPSGALFLLWMGLLQCQSGRNPENLGRRSGQSWRSHRYYHRCFYLFA